jgi:Kef-type K+ transport system membrane component KefB
MEHNPAIALFLVLGVIITASRIGGTLARRFGQPRVLGELIAGVVLGPTLLDLLHAPVLHSVDLRETITQLAQLGVLLLMFLVGLEVDMRDLASVGVLAGIAGFAGAAAPVLLAFPIVLLFGYGWQPALFTGVTLAATSVSISAQVLLELGVLRTKVGSALLATALIDDVIAILMVSLAIAVSTGTGEDAGAGVIVGIVARMGVYLTGAFALAWFFLPRLINLLDRIPAVRQSYGMAAIALIVALLYGWSAEALGGVAAITGAFVAGVGISRAREDIRHEVEATARSIAYTLLVPIFFISVGLETDLRAFPLTAFPLAGLLLVAALVSKVGGCGLGARLGGFSSHESLQLGVCMISRGEVGLIIASLGLASGVFQADDPLFASLFLVIVLTTVVTPLLVRQVFRSG